MSDLEALSLPELEALLVRIRAEIEVRERAPEPAPPRRILTRTRAAAAPPVSDRPAEAETPVEPVAAVEGAVAGVEAESPGPTPAAEAVAAAVALPQEAPAEPGPQPPPREAEAEAAPEAVPVPAPPPEPEAPPIKYMHPSNRNLIWSGEGKAPPWVEIWLYTGGSLFALEVAAEKLRPRPKPSFALMPATVTKPEPPGKPPRRRRRHHPQS